MTKLLFQKRTYVGWAALFVIPMLMTLALYLNAGKAHHDNGPGGFITLAAHNGLLMPVAAIVLLASFLLPLLASMSGSFQLAGEAESGTIKTWLVNPVSRGGVLMSKWVAAVVYLIVGLVLVAIGGYIAGGIAFGFHAPTLLSGGTVSIAHGMGLTALSYLLVLVATLCVISLAMFFATFTNSSLTAAIAALVIVIVLNIIGSFSYFNFLKPYLFTNYFDTWQNFFRQPIDWHPIQNAILTFVVYIVVLMTAGWYVFRRKDVLV